MTAVVDGPLVTVTLQRPQRLNAQTPEMWDGLLQVQRQLTPTTRVVVLRGAGRAFSAGLDRDVLDLSGDSPLRALAAGSAAAAQERIELWQRAFDWRSSPGLVSIAAVQGHAIGAGLQLALGADLRLLADDAQLRVGEPMLGLVPDLGGTKRLVDALGYERALAACLADQPIGAEEAVRSGLALRVVPAAALDRAVAELVAAVLAVPARAAVETKALLLGAAARTQTQQQAAERQAQYRRLRELAGFDDESTAETPQT